MSPAKNNRWRILLGREISAARRVAVLGAGNAMKGDDAAGLEAAAALKSLCRGRRPGERTLRVIRVDDVPENYTSVLRRFAPDLVILIDAALGGRRPGAVFSVELAAVSAEDLSTHKIPLSAFVRYLEKEIRCRVLIIGIEPRSLAFGAPVAAAVKAAAGSVAAAIRSALGPPRSSSASRRRCS